MFDMRGACGGGWNRRILELRTLLMHDELLLAQRVCNALLHVRDTWRVLLERNSGVLNERRVDRLDCSRVGRSGRADHRASLHIASIHHLPVSILQHEYLQARIWV